MKKRQQTIKRKTNETDVSLTLNIDGSGKRTIASGIPFFDHMLDLFSVHGLFDLDLKVKGDIEVDYHHSIEDIGICLGQAFHESIGSAKGIKRYASLLLPMDESLCQIAIDVCNRPFLKFDCTYPANTVGSFDVELIEEFFKIGRAHV